MNRLLARRFMHEDGRCRPGEIERQEPPRCRQCNSKVWVTVIAPDKEQSKDAEDCNRQQRIHDPNTQEVDKPILPINLKGNHGDRAESYNVFNCEFPNSHSSLSLITSIQ